GISASLNMPPHAYMENNRLLGEVEYLEGKEQLQHAGINGKEGWWAPAYRQEDVLPEFTRRAIHWLDDHLSEHGEDPFFLYMPLNAPHAPIVPNKDFAGRNRLGKYGDFCMEVDWSVGSLLDWLDKKGLAENTLIIFTADNGCSPQAGFKDLQAMGHYPSYIFRGLKGSLWEGGHRVPFLARWPARIESGSVSNVPVCLTDLMATLADLFTTSQDPASGEDSFSLLEAFSGGVPSWVETRGIIHHSDAGHFAVRRGKWKLVLHEKGGTRRHNPKDQPVINPAEIQLFDMENDPSETTNIQHLHPEVTEDLMSLLARYIREGRSNEGPVVSEDTISRWPQIEV
ncbi:MAG: sulfatase-like hydrolase/transferase, partial [Bacteroidales bacterium]|nr:sulfatase-like hydrolase/transferase [Bacteroidales bacterium]